MPTENNEQVRVWLRMPCLCEVKPRDYDVQGRHLFLGPGGRPLFSLTNCRMLSHISSGARVLKTRNANVAALDRYKLIRNFFRKQHSLAPQTLILSSRHLTGPLKFKTQPCNRATDLIPNPCRSFHSSISRPFSTSHIPENSPKKHEETARTPENSKSQSRDQQLNQEPYVPLPRNVEDYPRFFRRLALSLPHPHRPTRDDFLNVATGFWQRVRIRFKWFTIKSFRKFNADDISAFITWFVMSQTLWILVGT